MRLDFFAGFDNFVFIGLFHLMRTTAQLIGANVSILQFDFHVLLLSGGAAGRVLLWLDVLQLGTGFRLFRFSGGSRFHVRLEWFDRLGDNLRPAQPSTGLALST